MKTHVQHTITGELEITDSKNMKVIKRKIILTAEKHCSLCFRHFSAGDRIEVTFPAQCDLWEESGAGPWMPGGRTAQWLKTHATKIFDIGRNMLIHSQIYSGVNVESPPVKLLYIMAEMIDDDFNSARIMTQKECWAYYKKLKAKIIEKLPEQEVRDFVSQLRGLQVEVVEDWYKNTEN